MNCEHASPAAAQARGGGELTPAAGVAGCCASLPRRVEPNQYFVEYFTFGLTTAMLAPLQIANTDALLMSNNLISTMEPTRCFAEIQSFAGIKKTGLRRCGAVS